MSFEAIGWAYQQDLPPMAKFTLVTLANRADEEGVVYPSVRWLVRKTGMAERTVRQHLTYLQEHRLLQSEVRFREDGGRTSNLYRLSLAQLGLKLPPPAADAGGVAIDGKQPAADAGAPLQQMPHPPAADAPHKTKEETKEGKKEERGAARLTPIPPDFQISDRVRAWAQKKGFEQYLEAHFEWFVDYAKARPTKVRYTDWDAAFRVCMTSDWGGIRKAGLKAAKRPDANTTCQEPSGTDVCGMPGKSRGGGKVRCDHCELKHQERTRGPVSPEVRSALDRLTKKQRVGA